MERMLDATVVIDYQNVHLTGANLFAPHVPYHEVLIHPLHYANQVIAARNGRQREGYAKARLAFVLVYRGLPSPEHDPRAYARNMAHKAEWEKDRRVSVTYRPLKYRYQYTATGQRATDISGLPIVVDKSEKGVDVLCALALVREVRLRDLVILASQDTDLEPALEEAVRIGRGKVETASWYEPTRRDSREIRPSRARLWNTRLSEQSFRAAQDPKDYA